MRIAFVTNNYTPYASGIVSSLNATCKALQAQGHEVIIITLDFLGPTHHDPAHIVRLPTYFKYKHKQNHLALPLNAYKHMLTATKDFSPDIIHSQHPFILGITALHVARDLQLPIVFTFHTLYESYIHYVPLPAAVCKAFIRNRINTYGNAVNALIAPSKPIVDYVKKHGVKKTITVLPSGLQDIFVHEQCPQKPSENTGTIQLLFVSRFTDEKNIPFLLRTLALLQQKVPGSFQATFAGYGYAYEALYAYAQELKLTPTCVEFIHNPPQTTIAQLYAQADIFIFASTTETQGLVLIEAMAAGSAVIATYGPGQKNLIKNGENGFLIHNEQEMCDKIKLLIKNKIIRSYLQHQAWLTAQNYTSSKTTHKLQFFYHTIIKKYHQKNT